MENKAFNPADFGIKPIRVSIPCGHKVSGSYVRLKRNVQGDTVGMDLVLSEDDAKLIIGKFGDRVDVGFDPKGNFYVYKPASDSKGRQVNFGKGKIETKAYISVSAGMVQYTGIMGNGFKRMFLESEVFAGGAAVKLKLNGVRE